MFFVFLYNRSMPRSLKRVIIIIVYAILFFLIGLFFYLIIRPDPTCFDGKKNQGESGIDCGGPCQTCKDVIQAEDLIVEERTFVYGGPEKYDVIAKIYNPNDLYGSSEFLYKFILKDSSGNVLAEREGKGFILPAETKQVVEVGLTSQSDPYEVEIEIVNAEWIEFWEYEKPRLNVYKKQYNLISSGTGFSEVYGLVRNESAFDFHIVDINVVLRNPEGIPIAVNKTEMRDINAKEERDFRLLWPIGFPGEVQSVEAEASADVYDTDNFIKKYLPIPGGKFQRYE